MFDLSTLKSDQLKGALQAATAKSMQETGNPMLLYKSALLKDGWILGQEALPVSGKTVVLLSASITKGWIAFEIDTNKFLGETSVSLWSHEKPQPPQVPEPTAAKVNAQTSGLVLVEGLDVQAEMKGSTVGMEQAFNELIQKIVARLDSGEREFVNPRFRLDTDSYRHKKHGLKGVPKFSFLGWCNDKGEGETVGQLASAEDIV